MTDDTEVHRAVILDMGPYWWFYDDAILTSEDGRLKVRCAPGHTPRLIPKEEINP